MNTSLLPINENQEQRDIESIGAAVLEGFDTTKLSINPLDCDLSVLPHLALALDVNIEGLNESESRVYLQNAREIKKYIGSVYAVNIAAASIFDEAIKVEPWNLHNGVPGTYKILLDAKEKPLTSKNIKKVIKLIDTAKRKSAHLSGITFNMKNKGLYKQAITTLSSEVMGVYPKALEDLNLSFKQIKAVTIYMIETVVLKPVGV